MPETLDELEAVPFLKREEIEARASEVRGRHKMTTIPIDPVLIAEREGIKVNNAKFKRDNLVGLIMKDGDDVTVLVKQDDPGFRKRFTIAHELGHYFLHLSKDGEYLDKEANLFRQQSGDEGGSVGGDRRREFQANLFAAALLMPADEVRRYWKERDSIKELAGIFKVSPTAMGLRIAALDLD